MLDDILYIFKRIHLSKMLGKEALSKYQLLQGLLIATAHIIHILVPIMSYHPINQTPGTAPDKYHIDILKLEDFILFQHEATECHSLWDNKEEALAPVPWGRILWNLLDVAAPLCLSSGGFVGPVALSLPEDAWGCTQSPFRFFQDRFLDLVTPAKIIFLNRIIFTALGVQTKSQACLGGNWQISLPNLILL